VRGRGMEEMRYASTMFYRPFWRGGFSRCFADLVQLTIARAKEKHEHYLVSSATLPWPLRRSPPCPLVLRRREKHRTREEICMPFLIYDAVRLPVLRRAHRVAVECAPEWPSHLSIDDFIGWLQSFSRLI